MRTFTAVLLASILAVSVQAAPAPFPNPPRHIPNPETVLARLRAEGFDVGALRHESGERWTIDEAVTRYSNIGSSVRMTVVRRVIVAPGDPTGKLREVLGQRRRR